MSLNRLWESRTLARPTIVRPTIKIKGVRRDSVTAGW